MDKFDALGIPLRTTRKWENWKRHADLKNTTTHSVRNKHTLEDGGHFLSLRDWEKESGASLIILQGKQLEFSASLDALTNLVECILAHIQLPPDNDTQTDSSSSTASADSSDHLGAEASSLATQVVPFMKSQHGH